MAANTAEVTKQIVEALARAGSNSIIALAGVPGTGKSLMGEQAALQFAGHQLFVKSIHFHQAFGYEDFIEGLRPTKTGGFEILDGVLFDWNTHAHQDPTNRYVLIIEELTRANIAAVLGELFTLVEFRQRSVTLPISKRSLSIAPNLAILATFNPHDKNVLEIDDALLRRLTIIDCPPSSAQLREMLQEPLSTLADGPQLIDGLVKLFDDVEAVCGDRFSFAMPFGHGIFAQIRSAADLKLLWHQRIRHFLEKPGHPKHELYDEIASRYPWK